MNKSDNLNEKELIDLVYKKTRLKKKHITEMLEAMVAVAAEELAKGRKWKLRNFVSMEPYTKKARAGRNPSSGETIQIPPKTGIRLRISDALAEQMNNKV